jgi:hypothetical protein
MNTGKCTATAIAVLLMQAGGALPTTAAPERLEKHRTLALSFREGDSTRVDIVGITPRSGRIGRAEIERRAGRTRIELDVDKSLKNPQSLGSAYTAYVLWAVAPEGRAENLAELPPSRDFELDATTSLDTFGLVITAEPYAAVSRPGAFLVAETGVRDDARAVVRVGTIEYLVTPGGEASSRADLKTPLLLLGARRAVEMAKAAGAPEHAGSELREAEAKLAALEQISRGKKRLSKDAEVIARDVTRLAEHARVTAVQRAEEAAQAAERRSAARRRRPTRQGPAPSANGSGRSRPVATRSAPRRKRRRPGRACSRRRPRPSARGSRRSRPVVTRSTPRRKWRRRGRASARRRPRPSARTPARAWPEPKRTARGPKPGRLERKTRRCRPASSARSPRSWRRGARLAGSS